MKQEGCEGNFRVDVIETIDDGEEDCFEPPYQGGCEVGGVMA